MREIPFLRDLERVRTDHRNRRVIAEAARDAGVGIPIERGSKRLPGDPLYLRGLPVRPRHGGHGGVMPGTRPGDETAFIDADEAYLDACERRRMGAR